MIASSVVAPEHEQRRIFVLSVHEAVKVAAFEHGKVAGAQGANLETSLALGHFAPVTNHYIAATFHHEKDLLVVTMAMQSNPATGLHDV